MTSLFIGKSNQRRMNSFSQLSTLLSFFIGRIKMRRPSVVIRMTIKIGLRDVSETSARQEFTRSFDLKFCFYPIQLQCHFKWKFSFSSGIFFNFYHQDASFLEPFTFGNAKKPSILLQFFSNFSFILHFSKSLLYLCSTKLIQICFIPGEHQIIKTLTKNYKIITFHTFTKALFYAVFPHQVQISFLYSFMMSNHSDLACFFRVSIVFNDSRQRETFISM